MRHNHDTVTDRRHDMASPAEGNGSTRLPYDRQREIYLLALRNGSVDVSDLARRYDVTTETIRRDLSDLQSRQLLLRVHGGAVPVERHHHEPMVDARDMQNAAEKLRIAKEAILEVPEKGSVIIDSGSTGQRLAEVFPVDRNVTVVTNSLITALTLARRGIKDLTVLGGTVRTNTFAMVDAAAVSAVHAMRVDTLFISCDGFSFHRGLTTPYQSECLLKRAMVESARRVVAMVDASKFGNDEMFAYAALHEIDTLVTDTRANDSMVSVLSEHGIEVRRV
jgi:DeoR family transcriptional regulator, fructose operon transcriptional repressor